MADTTEATPAPETPRDIGPDGEKIIDMEYYELLEVRGDANETELKKAYRRLAIRYHPDKNQGDPTAEEMFIKVGEAYQTLSDPQLRAAYNKRGKKEAGHEGMAFEDAGKIFAQMFGGEKFHDWVGEIALGKEFERAMDVAMTPEERAALDKEMAEARGASVPTAPPTQTIEPHLANLHVSDTPSASAATSHSTLAQESGASTPTTPSASTTDIHKPTKPGKLTPEQKKQLEALDKERQKEREERIDMLAKKLIERIRPFCTATNPGGKDDPETVAFERRLRLEAEDLKLESFGVELCHLIGNIYVTKATTFLKLHRKSLFANTLGIPKWWSGVKEKGAILKEGVSFISSTLDIQAAMEDAEKRVQSGQEMDEEESKEREMDLMGKMLLLSWKGTKFEVSGVLRPAVDVVLSKKDPRPGYPNVTEIELENRAKAILLIGVIFKSVQPDESDDERRELERIVAQAAAKKKGPKHRDAAKHGSATPVAAAS